VTPPRRAVVDNVGGGLVWRCPRCGYVTGLVPCATLVVEVCSVCGLPVCWPKAKAQDKESNHEPR
jgi:uncharacterized protein (DUF983 family)